MKTSVTTSKWMLGLLPFATLLGGCSSGAASGAPSSASGTGGAAGVRAASASDEAALHAACARHRGGE